MTMRTAAAFLFLCASLLVAGPAAAITGGSPDTTHPYVGAARNGVNVCSGTLVSPTLFLTAAHCFSDTTSVFGTDAAGNPIVHVKFDLAGGRLVVSGENHGDPAFCSACKGGTPGVLAHDIAVVTLDSPVSIPGYAYPSLARDGFDAALPNGASALIVGYGTQDFETGGGQPQPLNNGLRYAAQTQLNQANDVLSDSFLKLASSQSNANGGICFGDSGGPVLYGSTILAVDSFVMNNGCKGVSYAYRVDTPAARAFLAGFGL